MGFRHWKASDYGSQAIALISALGDDLDEGILLRHLEKESAVNAYDFLRGLAFSDCPITDLVLRNWLISVDL